MCLLEKIGFWWFCECFKVFGSYFLLPARVPNKSSFDWVGATLTPRKPTFGILLQCGSGQVLYTFSTNLYHVLHVFWVYNVKPNLFISPFESQVVFTFDLRQSFGKTQILCEGHEPNRHGSMVTVCRSKAVEQEGSRFLQWKLEHGNKEAPETTSAGKPSHKGW